MTLLSRFPAQAFASLAALLFLAACDDEECEVGASKCAGDSLFICDYSEEKDRGFWREMGCSGSSTCATVDGGAICATSNEPDARCEGRTSDDPNVEPTFCEDDVIIRCTASGYGEPWMACQYACAQTETTALCAVSSEPDPLCAGAAKSLCVGDTSISCDQGFRVDESNCAKKGAVCLEDENGPFCALSESVDPSCTDDSGCDGSLVLSCRSGHRISETPCETGSCAMTSWGAKCFASATLEPACEGVVSVTDSNRHYAGYACDGNDIVECFDGYLVGRYACAENTCHAFPPSDAACVSVDTPDPNCRASEQYESYCDGNVQQWCEHGYPTFREPCGSDQHCSVPDGYMATCYDN